jgi:hypothetical protein
MRLSNYTLTPTRINNAKAKARLYKLSDGGGLVRRGQRRRAEDLALPVPFWGSRREITIGKFPEVGVADARERHFEMRVDA